jgi:hypothetical protein
VFTNVVNIERSRSSDADASWSCRKRAGSTLFGAVIAWVSFKARWKVFRRTTVVATCYLLGRPRGGWSA